ncbi:cytochrome c oxidase, cbb3-type, subunit III [compost metagenome]
MPTRVGRVPWPGMHLERPHVNQNSLHQPLSRRQSAWRAILPVLLSLPFAGVAVAQSASQEAGKQIAAQGTAQGVAACASCHGAKGEGNAAFPRLAGTGEAYLQAQLEAFGNGSRKNPVMQPMAEKLTPEQRLAVAAYYSRLPAPMSVSDMASAKPADAGAWLATRGRGKDQLPACAQCHGPGGSGVGTTFPPLAGLPAAYITAQLQAWKAGTRPPGPMALMVSVAKKLSDPDISAVAAYYAALAPSAGPVAVAQTGTKKGQP